MKLKLRPMLPVISVIALIVCCPMEPSKSSSTLQWPCSLFTYGLFCCSTTPLLLLLLLYADIAVSRFISVGFSRETNYPNPNRFILEVLQKQKYHQHLDFSKPDLCLNLHSSSFSNTSSRSILRPDFCYSNPLKTRYNSIDGLVGWLCDIRIAGLNRVILRCSRRPLPR